MPRLIELLVSPTGETRLTTTGFAGGSCQEASRFLETTLGDRLREQKTAEFYAATAAEEQTVQQ